MSSHALRNFYELMARQDGAAHVKQARALGVTRGHLASRHAALEVLQPGVLGTTGTPPDPLRDLSAAYLSVRYGGRTPQPRRVAVAGFSAARGFGRPLPRGVDLRPQLIAPYSVRATCLVGAELRRVGDWGGRMFATVGGRVTTVPVDTVLDLAAHLPRDDLFSYVQDELFRRPAGRARLLSRCREGVDGSGDVREVVAALDTGVDSVLHRNGHRHLAVVHLPKPRCGVVLVGGMGEVDCVLQRPLAAEPPWGMVVHWDGDIHRVSKRKRRHDAVSDRRLRRDGWASVRYGWADHEEPADMYADLTETWAHVIAGPRSWR